MAEDLQFETRFSKSRGIFPYVLGLIGLVVVVVLFMLVTGIGRDSLPFSEYLKVRAPMAADGSEAISLQDLKQTETEKSLTIEKFTLPSQMVNVPLNPPDLPAKGTATFQTVVMLDEKGLGGYNLQFRLPNDGPFVPHKDERPDAPPPPPSDEKPKK